MVIGCFKLCVPLFAFGNNNFNTFGVAIVDVMRKNNRRKNIISFREAEYTSPTARFLRLKFMSLVLVG